MAGRLVSAQPVRSVSSLGCDRGDGGARGARRRVPMRAPRARARALHEWGALSPPHVRGDLVLSAGALVVCWISIRQCGEVRRRQ